MKNTMKNTMKNKTGKKSLAELKHFRVAELVNAGMTPKEAILEVYPNNKNPSQYFNTLKVKYDWVLTQRIHSQFSDKNISVKVESSPKIENAPEL